MNDMPTVFKYCPFCGHALADDMTAEKRFGVQVKFCPPERLRLIYTAAGGSLTWGKLK